MRVLDLFAGELGWSRIFAARGHECVCVDIKEPKEIPKGCSFIKADIMEMDYSINRVFYYGDYSELGTFDFICASSPCEEFSVHGMKHFFPNPKYPSTGIKLFEHTRRICQHSGIPFVMENVRSAQNFVGTAVNHCGPFYLWGSGVPPLLHRGITKGMSFRYDKVTGKRILEGGRKYSSKSRQRAEETAKIATIPPELANCVADYAERLFVSI